MPETALIGDNAEPQDDDDTLDWCNSRLGKMCDASTDKAGEPVTVRPGSKDADEVGE